jgi:DUF971 family protein/molybdopterin converting factor small subunit
MLRHESDRIGETILTPQTETPVPTGINLHRQSRVLEIGFADGVRYSLPCEYLRVYSPSAQNCGPVHGKIMVNIASIDPQGQEALLLTFDDGHHDRYSWPFLYALGQAHVKNWTTYLQRLTDAKITRCGSRGTDPGATLHVTVFYFMQLAEISGTAKENIRLPVTVTNVQTFLGWLRKRGPAWTEAFEDSRVQVTVNKRFAELFTSIESQDEVGIVPATK